MVTGAVNPADSGDCPKEGVGGEVNKRFATKDTIPVAVTDAPTPMIELLADSPCHRLCCLCW